MFFAIKSGEGVLRECEGWLRLPADAELSIVEEDMRNVIIEYHTKDSDDG